MSALESGGTPVDALLRTFDDDVRLVASEETLAEFERVMTDDRLPFIDADRTQYLAILRREATVVQPDADVDVVRDPDDKFVEVALSGDADYVVSGDQDVLDIGLHDGIEMVAPDEFIARVE